jgi:light-regulated signal transduction histidine kinase (bacteriophytochrome)
LQRHQAQSERSAREFQEFLYSASHDLQEPLRKVEGFGALLDKQYGEALAGDGSDYLQRMRAATQRMQRMLDALLVLSRVATQARPFTRVDLSCIARDACAELAGAISDCGARVTSADLPVIEADGEQLRKLFWHVLDNALKFRRVGEAPVICVTARLLLAAPAEADGPAAGHATECCELAFADNGIGFEARYSERIFAPFQRLHGRGAYAGSGLGLAICRRIVQRHGGTITATGVPGAGTTVRVVLPIAQPGEPAQTRAMQPTH